MDVVVIIVEMDVDVNVAGLILGLSGFSLLFCSLQFSHPSIHPFIHHQFIHSVVRSFIQAYTHSLLLMHE